MKEFGVATYGPFDMYNQCSIGRCEACLYDSRAFEGDSDLPKIKDYSGGWC